MSLTKGDKLFSIQNCNCKERMKQWTGALLGQKAIGCGVNVMVFLDLFSEDSIDTLGMERAIKILR